MVTLTISGRLVGLNDYTKACRGNKYEGANMKKEAEEFIMLCIKQQIPNVHFDAPVELHFRWYEPNRKRDLDNVCFAKKFILDALVKAGTIKTDGWNGVMGFTDEFFITNNPRVEVDIEFCDRTLPF